MLCQGLSVANHSPAPQHLEMWFREAPCWQVQGWVDVSMLSGSRLQSASSCFQAIKGREHPTLEKFLVCWADGAQPPEPESPFWLMRLCLGIQCQCSSTIWYVAWWSLKQSHMVLCPRHLGMGQPKLIILHEAQWSQGPHGTRVPSLLLIPVSAGSIPSQCLAHYRTQDVFAEWMNE